jgi:hypothetical protein
MATISGRLHLKLNIKEKINLEVKYSLYNQGLQGKMIHEKIS